MYESSFGFPGNLFGEFDRLRRELDDFFTPGTPTGIRAAAPGSFPALNVGHTPESIEVYAFAPGLDTAKLDITLDRGVLSVSGERVLEQPDAQATVHSRERTGGRFQRAVSLPDDVDPGRVEARYRDGVLQISIARQKPEQPQRISVQ